jgi:hypothetical protein
MGTLRGRDFVVPSDDSEWPEEVWAWRWAPPSIVFELQEEKGRAVEDGFDSVAVNDLGMGRGEDALESYKQPHWGP